MPNTLKPGRPGCRLVYKLRDQSPNNHRPMIGRTKQIPGYSYRPYGSVLGHYPAYFHLDNVLSFPLYSQITIM